MQGGWEKHSPYKRFVFISDGAFYADASKKIVMWDMRFNDNSIEEYINNNDIDIVIVAYTEGSSISKQNMFAFD